MNINIYIYVYNILNGRDHGDAEAELSGASFCEFRQCHESDLAFQLRGFLLRVPD